MRADKHGKQGKPRYCLLISLLLTRGLLFVWLFFFASVLDIFETRGGNSTLYQGTGTETGDDEYVAYEGFNGTTMIEMENESR